MHTFATVSQHTGNSTVLQHIQIYCTTHPALSSSKASSFFHHPLFFPPRPEGVRIPALSDPPLARYSACSCSFSLSTSLQPFTTATLLHDQNTLITTRLSISPSWYPTGITGYPVVPSRGREDEERCEYATGVMARQSTSVTDAS